MPEIVVSARSRDQKGKNVNRRLRAQGLIPGVLYGAKKEAVPVAVSPKEIGSILRSASGENTLFDLDLGGSRRKVILKEFQVEPLKGRLLHADFYEVALDKTLEVDIHVEIQGVPVGVKVQGGVLQLVQGWRPVTEVRAEKPWTVDTVDEARSALFARSEPGVPPFMFEVGG